jgi:hypothetical protein
MGDEANGETGNRKLAISKSSSLIPTFLIQFDCGIAADTAAATEAGADGRNPR